MAPSNPQFSNPPPPLPTGHTLISFPHPQILLVTLNRPEALNCVTTAQHHELHALWQWLDNEPSMRCGIITGKGKAFCAGADLREWNTQNQQSSQQTRALPPTGFLALSRRHRGRKPIIAAIHGACLGGGFEAALSCDLILASSSSSTFGLPEVRVGVIALAGALPRLPRTVGRQRAMEMVLLGKQKGAEEMRGWGVVNEVVDCKDREGVVSRAVEVARGMVEGCAPESVVVSKMGVDAGWAGEFGDGEGRGGVESATTWLEKEVWGPYVARGGENMKEGVRAFVEKRRPRWGKSKL
ncbi:MAG: hypothetical protein Q9220_005928 [cf. Caloplaca sp. 1 TL-2023]